MEDNIKTNESGLFSPIFMRLLIPFGFAFFASTFIGSITSMIAPHITADFGLSPAQLGGFISINLAAFGLAQFPLGVMLDRYGGRSTLISMLILAFAGTLLFASAKHYAALLTARALIGAGFAGALLSSFKSFTHWLPKRRLPLAFSIQSFVGGAGFMAATHPVTLALEYFFVAADNVCKRRSGRHINRDARLLRAARRLRRGCARGDAAALIH